MSGSTNTFFAAMNSTAQAMGDLTATKTVTTAAVLPGASIGYAVAIAVAQDRAPAAPYERDDGWPREWRIHHELPYWPYVGRLSLRPDFGLGGCLGDRHVDPWWQRFPVRLFAVRSDGAVASRTVLIATIPPAFQAWH